MIKSHSINVREGMQELNSYTNIVLEMNDAQQFQAS